jgi:hypothetical protein
VGLTWGEKHFRALFVGYLAQDGAVWSILCSENLLDCFVVQSGDLFMWIFRMIVTLKFWEGYQMEIVASKLALIAYCIQWVRKQKLIKCYQNITGQTEFHHGLISGLQAIVGTLSLCDVLFTMRRNIFHCLCEDVLNSCLHWWRQHLRAGIAL